MAHIKYFRVDGLLGRTEPLEYTLDRHVNVFFGENGCGKTTLLKILAAALDRDSKAIVALPVQRAEVHIYSITRDATFKLIWDRTERDKAKVKRRVAPVYDELKQQLALSIDFGVSSWKIQGPDAEKVSPRGWPFSFLQTHRLYGGGDSHASEASLNNSFADALNRQWLQYYNKTLAQVRQVQEEGLRAVLRQVLSPSKPSHKPSGLELSVIHERVERFLNRQHYPDALTLGSLEAFKKRYDTDENLRRVVVNLSNVEGSIEEAVAPVNSFLETLKKLLRTGKEISYSDAELKVKLDSGESISLSQLSSGEKHLLKILLTAMNVEGNSIIIDEPELSMHIDWQRALVGTVRSLNGECQQILASHSPEIMADVPDACIFRL
jgi:predicted ATPase